MRNSYMNSHLTCHSYTWLIKTQHFIKIIKKNKLKSVRGDDDDQLKKVERGWRENVRNNKENKYDFLFF